MLLLSGRKQSCEYLPHIRRGVALMLDGRHGMDAMKNAVLREEYRKAEPVS